MANPQKTDAHLRIAHSITEAIMMRNFSKRQRSILDLILRLSWGCAKRSAVIPKQKDFKIVGIAETKIKSELEWLINANVIECYKNTNEYGFLKDFDKWAVSLVPEYDKKRFNELLHINLTSQNGNLFPEKGRNFPKNREVVLNVNTDEMLASGQSKESIKESKDIYSVDFLKFWDIFPKRTRKKDACKSWDKLIKNKVNISLLIECATNYALWCNEKGKMEEFILHPSTFLNSERYLDYKSKEEIPKSQSIQEQYIDEDIARLVKKSYEGGL